MKLDLEGFAQFSGDHKMFLILMQMGILAILPQLNRVPLVGFLKTGEAVFDAEFFAGKKPFEGLGKSVCKALNGCGGNKITTTTFECLCQIVLRWERSILLILFLDHLKHLIIESARPYQALHKHGALLFIGIDSILKRSHEGILIHLIRDVKREKAIVSPAIAAPCPLQKKDLFHPHG
ncbi:MAG: hypothetical protein AUG51_20820 [Acidobacteria bacterium 13_1_20CM_3_53_8]|nr:MAG: hypothetical protein AUG51_20820 [Acidobacteria bacterium 13_1_20CM_3_53_8]